MGRGCILRKEGRRREEGGKKRGGRGGAERERERKIARDGVNWFGEKGRSERVLGSRDLNDRSDRVLLPPRSPPQRGFPDLIYLHLASCCAVQERTQGISRLLLLARGGAGCSGGGGEGTRSGSALTKAIKTSGLPRSTHPQAEADAMSRTKKDVSCSFGLPYSYIFSISPFVNNVKCTPRLCRSAIPPRKTQPLFPLSPFPFPLPRSSHIYLIPISGPVTPLLLQQIATLSPKPTTKLKPTKPTIVPTIASCARGEVSRLWCGGCECGSGGGARETSAARREKRARGVMVCPAARADMRLKRISSARGKRAVGAGTREVRTGAEVEAAREWRISSTGAARAVEKRSVNSRIPARWSARLGFGMG